MTHDAIVSAVRNFARGDNDAAVAQASAAAAAEPDDPFYRHAHVYLQRLSESGATDVYATPDGFAAFIRGGGNVLLYASLSRELNKIYHAQRDIRLLDIGVGDGLALLPALADTIAHIDLVELSAAMLDQTTAALSRRGISHRAFNQPIEAFLAAEHGHYTIAQATFSLHNLSPAARAEVFAWLRQQADQVLVAEFDVRLDAEPDSAAYIDALVGRFRRGLAEYTGEDTDLVAQGFLLPMFFRNFTAGGAPALWEQPVAVWIAELRAAGFADVQQTLIHRYWWADAYLLRAR